MKRPSNKKGRGSAATTADVTYLTKPAFPTPPQSVTIILRGLLTLAFDGKDQCEIGAFNAAPPHQRHNLLLRSWRKAPNCPGNTPTNEYATPTSSVEFRVVGERDLDGVYAFVKDPVNPFNRFGPMNDPQDFNWALDFEGPDFYNVPLDKNPNTLRPRVIIKNGLFYTFHKTMNRFLASSASIVAPDRPLNTVGEIVAVNIYLNTGGYVELIIDNHVVDRFDQSASFTHQVDVLNRCDQLLPGCQYDPLAGSASLRNDFYLYYNSFNRPAGQDQYNLITIPPILMGTPPSDLCRRSPTDTTDPAPCGPVVFGKSRGNG